MRVRVWGLRCRATKCKDQGSYLPIFLRFPAFGVPITSTRMLIIRVRDVEVGI